MELARAVAFVAALGGLAWSGYLVAHYLVAHSLVAHSGLAGARSAERCAAAFLAAAFGLTATFWALTPAGLFRWWFLALAWPALAAWLHHRLDGAAARAMLAVDADRAAEALRPPAVAAAACAAAAIVTLRALRALGAPTLAWDSLTYHLVRAADWAQAGGYVSHPAPDAWSYYRHFPPVGDLVWSLGLVFFPSGLATALLGCGVAAMIAVGVYATARTLGASSENAVLAAAACLLVPSVSTSLVSGYVDAVALGFTVCGASALCRTFETGSVSHGLVALTALGLVCGTKQTGLLPLAFALPFLFGRIATLGPGERRLWMRGTAAALALLGTAMLSYASTGLETGSPFYPMRVGPLPYNEQLDDLLRGKMAGAPELSAYAVVELMFLENRRGPMDSYALGPHALVLVALALAGALRAFLRREHRGFVAFVGLTAAAALAIQLYLPSTVGNRVAHWAVSAARYLLPHIGLAAALAATCGAPGRWLLAGVVLVGFDQCWPRWVTQVDVHAVTAIATPVAFGAAIALAGAGLRRTLAAGVLALSIAAAVALPWADGVRQELRPLYYRALLEPQSAPFDIHPLAWFWLEPVPLWPLFDAPAGQRIAVTVGWGAPGHNRFVLPFYGSRLQNTVRYIPITRDGAVLDYRNLDWRDPRLDAAAWHRRLLDEGIEIVIVLPPDPPEAVWLLARRDLFVPIAIGRAAMGRAYRVDRAKLAGELGR